MENSNKDWMTVYQETYDEFKNSGRWFGARLTNTPTPEQMEVGWQVLRLLLPTEETWGLALNASDLFYSACADTTEFDIKDLPLLIEAMTRFGIAGEVAFQWKVRGMCETPVALDRRTWKDQYPSACEWIKDKFLYQETRDILDKAIEAYKRTSESEEQNVN